MALLCSGSNTNDASLICKRRETRRSSYRSVSVGKMPAKTIGTVDKSRACRGVFADVMVSPTRIRDDDATDDVTTSPGELFQAPYPVA